MTASDGRSAAYQLSVCKGERVPLTRFALCSILALSGVCTCGANTDFSPADPIHLTVRDPRASSETEA